MKTFSTYFTKVLILMICTSLALPAHANTLDDMLKTLYQMNNTLEKIPENKGLVLGATTMVVKNNSELITALNSVSGGETIQLAPGTYGAITIVGGTYSQMSVGGVRTQSKSPVLTVPVTITSQDPNNHAVVDKITIFNSNNWIIDSLVIKPPSIKSLTDQAVQITGNNNIVQNCYVTYSYDNSDSWSADKWLAGVGSGIKIGGGTNNIVQRNYISNIYMGIEVSQKSPNTKVLNNVVNYFSGDGMRGLGDGSLFEGNIIKNIRNINSNHPDSFQSWSVGSDGSSGSGEVRGVTVRGNVFLISENLNHPLAKNMQGIGMFDGDFKDWVIEDNVIMSDTYHGITLLGAKGVKIDHNTVINIRKNTINKTWMNIGAHKDATTSSGLNIVTNNLVSTLILAPGATEYNATSGITLLAPANFSGNNFVIPMANYDSVYVDLVNFNARLKSPATYNNAGTRIFIDPRATTAPSIPTTPTTPPVVIPAPTVTITSSLTTAKAGESATLSWTSTGAEVCTASGDWSGAKNSNGSMSTGALTVGSKTFTLSCTGAGGSTSKSVSVSVSAVVVATNIPTATLSLSATSTLIGSTATIWWSSASANTCIASGDWSGTKSLKGSEVLPPYNTAGTKTYSLTCFGAGGNVTKTTNVNVSTLSVNGFKIGDRVAMTKNVNVRKSGLISTDTLIGVNQAGSQGVITAGPTVSTDRFGVITWYTVNFDTGYDGWVGADNFARTLSTVTQTYVQATAIMNVRSTPNGAIIGQQVMNNKGVLGTQTPIKIGQYTWVYVDFPTGADGYVAQEYTRVVTADSTALVDNSALITALNAQLQALIERLKILMQQQPV